MIAILITILMVSESVRTLPQIADNNVRIKSIRESQKWNTFLVSLYAKLSTYEMQKDKNKYNVNNIEYWGRSGKEQGIEITKNTFNLFLDKMDQYNITECDNVKNITITESRLQELNHVLSITLKREVNVACSVSNELLIKGDYIKVSDFIKNDGNLNTNNQCKNVMAVNVFALNTIFFDRDILLTGVNMSIISPRWEIIDSKVIELRGVEGDSRPISRSNHGRVGEPGLPGKPGGNFFGIGAEFVNGKKLSIVSVGGRGGAGSDGEIGPDGKNGASAVIKLNNRSPCRSDWCEGDKKFQSADGTKWDCARDFYEVFDVDYPYYRDTVGFCTYTIFGKPGSKGGSGGDGGKGGKGGNRGNIVLFELNKPSGISKYSKTGQDGESGRGGLGGIGGITGNYVIVTYTFPDRKWSEPTGFRGETRNDRGISGDDGANQRGIQDPEAAAILEPAKNINKYKNYLRANLNHPFAKYPLMEFLEQLDKNDIVKSTYNTLELFNELKDLEEQFHKFNNGADLVPVYQLLLNRIGEYAQNPKSNENSNQYKKCLIFLYTAAQGRISYFNDRSESSLIIHIDKHLDLIKKDIKTLHNLQAAANKGDLINSYKESFKRDIDRQIDEAKYVIDRQITPEINNITVRIDNQIDVLISETKLLEKLAQNEKQELIKKREKLKRALKFRGLFSGLKIVGQVMNFFGPIGLAAGSLIGSTSTAVESTVIDDQQQSLRSDLQSYGDQIEAAKSSQVDHLNEVLTDISEKISVYPDKFNDTLVKIEDMKNRLSKDHENKFRQVQLMEIELKQELKRKAEDLTGSIENVKANDGAARAIAVMGRINQAVEVYAVGFDIYNKVKNDKSMVSAISAAIAQKDAKIEQLEKYEKNIHDITIPMLQKMEDNLRGIANKLNTKSQVVLDVTKWQVQSYLKDIKLKMKKLTRMFEDIHEDLPHCIEMLEDTMTTLINVYDRIQVYQKEQKFANFYADISYITGSDVNIVDPRLSKIVNLDHLEKLIRSNHVIIKHKTAIEAFKNFVFPLAHEYLQDFVLPSHLQLESNFENLLSTATTQIESVQSKIEIYKTYLNGAGYNPHIKLGPFTSQYVSTDPFFTWKNAQNKDLISKLLTGQRVIVRADINDSPSYKDAIKFSVAEFSFKAQNETVQDEINEILKGFEIEATHLGDSHYRCNNRIYRITSNTTNISYYLEKRSDGEPVSKSVTYVNLKESDSILSPYATWELVLMETTSRITFRDLQKYKDVVGLELTGEGSYIDNRRVDYSNLIMDNYYSVIETDSHSDLNLEPETIYARGANTICRKTRSVDASKNYHVASSSFNIVSLLDHVGNFFQ